jgi:two-component system, sensor histidine kinase RegB
MDTSGNAAARLNLRRLTALRYIALSACTLALPGVAPWLPDQPLPVALLGLLALFAALNALARYRTRRPRPISEGEFFGHLLLDIGGLSLLLYFTGGATNPLVSYLLVPVCIAAATLTRRLSWTVTGLAFACYSLLLLWYRPVPALLPAAHHAEVNLHVLGMWANFAVSAGLIGHFLLDMAAELRRQQRALARQREEQLRDEQLLSIATLAAGAAHELGTPLNTMQLLVDGAREDRQALAGAELDTLARQLERCRGTLRRLARRGELGDSPPAACPVREYLEALAERWRVIRPQARLQLRLDPDSPALAARFHPTLEPAVQNLLDNAADASAEVEMTARWDRSRLVLDIRDAGPGFRHPPGDAPVRPGASSKPGGLGLGLFLSHATIERHGGSVELTPAAGGGTLTRVLLPLPDPAP